MVMVLLGIVARILLSRKVLLRQDEWTQAVGLENVAFLADPEMSAARKFGEALRHRNAIVQWFCCDVVSRELEAVSGDEIISGEDKVHDADFGPHAGLERPGPDLAHALGGDQVQRVE